MTQTEVADRLDVAIDTYRRWDRGTAKPRSPQRQQHLAQVLETPFDVLFPIDEDPHVAVAMRREEAETASSAEVPSTAPQPTPTALITTDPRVTDDRDVPPSTPSAEESRSGRTTPAPRAGHGALEGTAQSDVAPEAPAPLLPATLRTSRGPGRDRIHRAGDVDTPGVVPDLGAVLATIDGPPSRWDGITTWVRRRAAVASAAFSGAVVLIAVTLAVVTSSNPDRPRGGGATGMPNANAGFIDGLAAQPSRDVAGLVARQNARAVDARRLTRNAYAAASAGDLKLAMRRVGYVKDEYGPTDATRRVTQRVADIRDRREERARDRRVAAAKARRAKQATIAASSGPAATPQTSTTPESASTEDVASNSSSSAGTSSGSTSTGSSTSQKSSGGSTSSKQARDPGLF